MNSEEVVDILNDLLTKNYSAIKGYQKAVELIQDPSIKTTLEAYVMQRNQFASQLNVEIVKLGGIANEADSFTSKIHRSWMDLKTNFVSNEDRAIMEEVLRGEAYTITDYEAAVKQLPAESKAKKIVAQQFDDIKNAKHRMLVLKIMA